MTEKRYEAWEKIQASRLFSGHLDQIRPFGGSGQTSPVKPSKARLLAEIESYIDFGVLAMKLDRIAPRPVGPQGGSPPFAAETMRRILVLKRLYNLANEEMDYELLDRMSYQRFCGLEQAVNIPDSTTI